MGLVTTHGAFEGSYSSFNQWRRAVAAAAGIDLSSLRGYGGREDWPEEKDEPLVAILSHSDCDGSLLWKSLIRLAARLESLIPEMPPEHAETTAAFAKGCRLAFSQWEDIDFR